MIATGEALPGDEGGALDACFPPAMRLHVGERLRQAVLHDRVLPKTEAAVVALGALGPGAARLYPFDEEVVGLLTRITGALARGHEGDPAAGPVPVPLGLAAGLVEGARARPFGALVPLDDAFGALSVWLPAGVVAAVERAAVPSGAPAPLALRAARAIALLELLQPDPPTARDLLGRVLADHLGASREAGGEALGAALDDLVARGVALHTRRHGYVIVTPALAATERGARGARRQRRGGEPGRARRGSRCSSTGCRRWSGRGGRTTCARCTPTAAARTTSRSSTAGAGRPSRSTCGTCRSTGAERGTSEARRRSVRGKLVERLIWIAGEDPARVRDLGTDLGRSRRQIRRATPAVGRPGGELGRMLSIEEARRDELEAAMREAVVRTFMEGTFYFRGEAMPARSLGESFEAALLAAVAAVLPRMLAGAPPPTTAPAAPPPDAVVKLPRGREVRSLDEMGTFLAEIERRIRAPLEQGAKKVRID